MTASSPTPAPTPAVYALDRDWVDRLRARAVASPRAQTMTTVTPFTGRPLAQLPVAGEDDVDLAYAGARAVQTSWAHLPLATRAEVLLRFHDLVLSHQVELLDLIQLESGKARVHAFEEIVQACQVARFYGRRGPGMLRPHRRPGLVPVFTQVHELRRPHGVVGVVAPWNYPLAVAVDDTLPALLAGNAVVLRPDPQSSLTALFAAELLGRAGLPSRVLQVVLGPGPTVGAAVLARADCLSFTGSTATGRAVAERAAARLVPVGLELGGKNPLYVAADADLDRAVTGAVRAVTGSAGQLCLASERLILHETIAADFLARFLPAVAAVRLSPTLTYDADMGSLVSARQFERVRGHVEDARSRGARVLVGGRGRPDVGPWFYEPTILDGVAEGMRAHRQETFGPVASVYRARSDAEAIRLANDTHYGLGASIWTRDLARGRRIAAAIRAGIVNINDAYGAAYASVAAPVGGMKDSGLGRRHGREGLLAYTTAQTIATQRLVPLAAPAQVRADPYVAGTTWALRAMKALGRP